MICYELSIYEIMPFDFFYFQLKKAQKKEKKEKKREN